MRRISPSIERWVLGRLYLGDAYREVANNSDIVISTVNRIAEDERKRTPDYDTLRDHVVKLRKHKLSIFDEARIHVLVEKLNNLGISTQKLEEYIYFIEQLMLEKDLKSNFLLYVKKIKLLETKYGTSAEKILKDFETIQSEIEKLKQEKISIELEINEFNVRKDASQIELNRITQKIKEALITENGLSRIGIANLSKLVRFIDQCEEINCDINEMKKLLKWRQTLKKTGMNPDNIGLEIEKYGTLTHQNEMLRKEQEKIKNDNAVLLAVQKALIENDPRLKNIQHIINSKTTSVTCKGCHSPIQIIIRTKQEYYNMNQFNSYETIFCYNCQKWSSYFAEEILSALAFQMLPESSYYQIP